MVNNILYVAQKSSEHSCLINTKFGDELVNILAQGSVKLEEIKEKSSLSGIELLTKLSQFISSGLLHKVEDQFELTIPVLTRDELAEYKLKMLPYVSKLVDDIISFVKTSSYQENLLFLATSLDFDIDTLNYLLLCCFGAAWGGKYLFEQLDKSERHSALIITDSFDSGLLVSMTSFTTKYTFTSFGLMNMANCYTLGNLFHAPNIVNYLFSMLNPHIIQHYTDIMDLFCYNVLDKCGEILISLKRQGRYEEDDELKIIFNLLESIGFIEKGLRVTVPIFTEEVNPILINLIRGYQIICANWYDQVIDDQFEIGKFSSTNSINYSIYWILISGFISELLAHKKAIQFPEDQQYISLVFTYPPKKVQSLCKNFLWNKLK